MDNKVDTKNNNVLPEYILKDPVLTLLSLPILPFILFSQFINNTITGISNSGTSSTPSYYKNDETWIISENKNGDIKVKVERLARR